MKPLTRFLLAAVAILAGALLLRLVNLDKSLWMDEVGSYALATAPDFIGAARADVHPPLYYALLRIGTGLTTSVPVLRLFSVLCGGLTLVVLLRQRDRTASLLSAALVACLPELIANAQELRHYALLNLLLTVALVATLDLLEQPDSKRARGWLLLATLLAAATHLVALFYVAALGTAVLGFSPTARLSDRIKNVALLIPAALLLVLVRFVFLTEATAITAQWWTGRFTFSAALEQFQVASGWEALHWMAAAVGRHVPGGEPLLLILAGVAVVIAGWTAWSSRDRRSLAALTVALVYWALLVGYSIAATNLAIARLIVPGMIPLLVSVGFGLARQSRVRLRRSAVVLATGLALTMTLPWLWHFAWRPREDLRGLTAALLDAHRPDDVTVFLGGAEYALRVYWPNYAEETIPLRLELAQPLPVSLAQLGQVLAARSPRATVMMIYRDDASFQQHPEVWAEISSRLRQTGRQERSVWAADYYHIARFTFDPR